VRILRAAVRRLTGSDVRALRAEVADLRAVVEQTNRVLMDLNHEVRSGSESALPLFLGWADRLRLDTDTAVAAAQVIERQLAEMRELVARTDR
jgi:hypothetical protein